MGSSIRSNVSRVSVEFHQMSDPFFQNCPREQRRLDHPTISSNSSRQPTVDDECASAESESAFNRKTSISGSGILRTRYRGKHSKLNSGALVRDTISILLTHSLDLASG
jgi:hypothetical protein